MTRLVLSILSIALAVLPVRGEIYLWTDGVGIKHFSNVSPPESGTALKIPEKISRSPLGDTRTNTGRRFQVLAVYDGDSIKVKGSDLTFMVRLAGIDAPETGYKKLPGQPFSQEAKQMLKALVSGKRITIKSYGTGAYNRQLAEVFTRGVNVNLALLKAGMAEVYRGETAKGLDLIRYRSAEATAKRGYKGIWSLGYRYQSPRSWRKQHPRN